MAAVSHRERLERTLSGIQPDRPPVALWRHFPVDDQDPHRLAQAHIDFQRRYDFDLVKVTPESGYMAKEWGGEDAWRGSPEGTRALVARGVRDPQGWQGLARLDPSSGRLGQQLQALRAIISALGPHTPVLETVFSPLSQMRKLAGEPAVVSLLRLQPDLVHELLEIITASTVDFVAETHRTGIAGIFFAEQFAQYPLLTEEEFRAFALPYNRRVLESAAGLWLNVLHLHGSNVMFNAALELPVQVVNWHDLETPPSLADGKQRFPGTVCGGLRQWETMAYGDPEAVRAEARAAMEAAGESRFILGTGCVTPIIAPHGNLVAARRSVEPA